MGIKWQDYITNEEVLARADTTSVEAMLMLRHLRWAGHVTRMASSSMPKAVFYRELSQGKRDRGAPRKRFKDQLKRQLTQACIDHSEWEALAEDREEWRGRIKTTADNFEEEKKNGSCRETAATKGLREPTCDRHDIHMPILLQGLQIKDRSLTFEWREYSIVFFHFLLHLYMV